MELSDEERIKLQMRPEDVETEESINDAAFTRDNSAMVGKQSKIKETTTQSQDGVTVYAAGGLDDDSMVFQHDEDRGNLAKISARGHGRHPDGRPTPDDVTKHVIVYKNATVAAENVRLSGCFELMCLLLRPDMMQNKKNISITWFEIFHFNSCRIIIRVRTRSHSKTSCVWNISCQDGSV